MLRSLVGSEMCIRDRNRYNHRLSKYTQSQHDHSPGRSTIRDCTSRPPNRAVQPEHTAKIHTEIPSRVRHTSNAHRLGQHTPSARTTRSNHRLSKYTQSQHNHRPGRSKTCDCTSRPPNRATQAQHTAKVHTVIPSRPAQAERTQP